MVVIAAAETKAWAYHRQPTGKDEWLTPPEIIQALGPFDLDPCAPVNRPWPMAENHYTILDNGLNKTWTGRIWHQCKKAERERIKP